jgi:hypothetical protein
MKGAILHSPNLHLLVITLLDSLLGIESTVLLSSVSSLSFN